jgi:hypothetical protein
MKKVFLALLFVGVTQLGMAQDEAFKKDVMKLVELSGSTGSMKAAKDQILKMIPQDKQAAFSKDFDAAMPSLYEKMTKIYMEVYTKEDIKGILAFYETPVGKKMATKSGLLVEKCMTAGQEWAAETVQGMMMKYMQ